MKKVSYEEMSEIIRRFNLILDQRCKLQSVMAQYLREPETFHTYKLIKTVFLQLQPVYDLRKNDFNGSEFNPFNK